MDQSHSTRKRCNAIATAAVFFLTLGALIASNRGYGFAIDEASYVWVAEEERLWFAELGERGWQSFSDEGLKRRWHFLEPPGARDAASHSNFNLPLSQHLINLSWLLFHRFVDELLAYRLANMLLFSASIACFFSWCRRQYSIGPAIVGAGLLAGMPRVFGHAHLATTETALGAFWLLTLLQLHDRTGDEDRSRCRPVRFALLLAMTMSVKLTGWFLAPAAGIWLLLYRPAGWKKAILLAAAVCPVLIVVLTPPLWHSPIGGMIDYLREASTDPWKIPVYLLGQGYRGDAPWWSGLFLTATTVPITTLTLALVGTAFRLFRRETMLFLLPAAVLLGVRSAGFMPLHDGERQFLPVFYCLPGLAVAGFAWLNGWINRLPKVTGAALTAILVLGAAAEPAADSVRYAFGKGLSYYNRAIGGLPGAAEKGMEIGYWWESVSPDDWRRLLGDLPAGTKIFVHPDHPGLEFMRRWGHWPEGLISGAPEEADFYLLFAKRSVFVVDSEADQGMVPTDLLFMMERSPGLREIRFENVRLAVLIPRR